MLYMQAMGHFPGALIKILFYLILFYFVVFYSKYHLCKVPLQYFLKMFQSIS